MGNHFRILLGLKEQVDKMSSLNRKFRAENAALQQEVDKLSRASEQLSSVESGLKESNRRLKENVEKFKKSSEQVMRTMQESLIRHEKDILNKVFDHMEFGDNKPGLSKEEFAGFWKQMPNSYALRWEKTGQTFEEIAGDDGVLDYQEFTAMCDQFAEQEAAHGGSED